MERVIEADREKEVRKIQVQYLQWSSESLVNLKHFCSDQQEYASAEDPEPVNLKFALHPRRK